MSTRDSNFARFGLWKLNPEILRMKFGKIILKYVFFIIDSDSTS